MMVLNSAEDIAMNDLDHQTWDGAMRRAHAAIVASERIYEEINAPDGRSNIDIEKHLRRSEVRAAHAQAWVALARELAAERDRYGHPRAVASGS
jgi:hypothetical protein